MSHNLRIKNFLKKKLHGKVIFHFLRYSVFYILNHSINFEICDSMMNISTWGRAHSWIYILNFKSFRHIFRKHFVWFGEQGPKSKPFLSTNLPQLIKNQLWWACGLLVFWRCAVEQSKIKKQHQPTIKRSHYTVIPSKL